MSRIVRFHKTGGPEVLQFDQIDDPNLKDNEVKIKVKAIGLNRAESMFRLGQYLEESTLPSKLGYEAAGVVEAVGPQVKNIAIGDIVSTVPSVSQGKYGVYGEVAIVPEKFVIKHPTSLTFEEACSVWMQYLTVYGALIDIAHIQKGDFVVITAASSSVGLAAIQICNLIGATPIATTRKNAKKQALLDSGAAFVVVTEEENLAQRLKDITNNKGARIVFDPVGGPTVLELAEGIAAQGILFQYGALSTESTPFPLKTSLLKGLTMRGYTLFEVISNEKKYEEGKKFVYDALSTGKLKPILDKVKFTLDQIVEAHRYLESNQQFGKIVVTV